MTIVKTKGVKKGNDDLQVATILSKTALNRLNMQVPELSKYVVAFKDLSQELPENTGIQVGMIIMDIHGKYIYVPVMAKAGDVQILESMFDADTKKFIPLTRKSVEWMVEKGCRLGTAERIPSSVARDPDLYDAIVPPKTGKFVYASEGRIGGFFATLPNIIKKATLRIMDEDYDLQEAMALVMDIDVAREHLLKETPSYVAPEGPPVPRVITSADGLTDLQVQDIMAKGYTVVNPPKSSKVVVESSDSQALTTIQGILPNKAVMGMKKNGDWVGVASLNVISSTCSSGFVAVTEDGVVLTDPKIVISPAEIKYDDVITRLKNKSLLEVSNGDYGMVFTGAGWLGPISVDSVTSANNWTVISCCDMTISMHP